jgi:hypothetical protein
MIDSQILDQAINILKPVAPAGQIIGAKVAASALWDWLKEKFKTRSAATAEAVADVEKSPEKEVNWVVLRAQLAKALAEDKVFRQELLQHLSKECPSQTNQIATATGDHISINQIHGSGNTISGK